MKLIHVTDTHLVKPGEMLFGLDPQARLEACVADINRHHADAGLCVITGDLTHWGEAEAYALLRDCLAPLAVPLHLVVGNHDEREAFLAAFPETPTDDNGFVQSVRETPVGRFLFLDTLQPGTHAGHYCEARLAWLEAQLADAGRCERPVYLFMHHPPFPVRLPLADTIGLLDADPVRDVVKPHAANVRHLFFGHVHRPISGSWCGIPFTTLRSTNHQCWLDFDATDTIAGSHEPPAYAIAFLDGETTLVHFHDYLDASEKFPMGTTDWADWQRTDAAPETSAETAAAD